MDLVLIKSNFSYECNVILTDISDHFTPILSLKTEKKKVKPEPRVHKSLNKCTIQRIRQKLSEINWDNYDFLCHEDFTVTFQNILLQTLDEHAPYVEVKDNVRKTEDWFTVGLSVSRKNKQRLLKQWLTVKKKHVGDDDNDLNCIYLKYKDYENMYYALVQKAKEQHTENAIKEANPRNKWKICNSILGRNKNDKNYLPEKFICKDANDDEILTQGDKDLANKFNNYFVDVGKNITKDLPQSNKSYEDYLKAQRQPHESFKLKHVNIAQIQGIIKNLKPKFSSGNDEISNFLIKMLCDVISVPLTMLINKSITEGHVASSLKSSIVVPIFKDGERQEFVNYRPISLLSCISKILGKLFVVNWYPI